MATLTITPIKTFVSGETVTPAKLNDLAESTVALTAGTIVAGDIASNAVITAKILNANVTTAKIDDEAVTAAKLADSAVITAKINNAAITAAKLNGAQTGTAPIYGCRAWVRFDGQKNTSGAASATNTNRLIIASGNVASVLRTAEGIFTVTFTTPMPTEDYAAVVSTRHAISVTYGANAETNIVSSSAVQIVTGNSVSGAFDPVSVNLAVFA